MFRLKFQAITAVAVLLIVVCVPTGITGGGALAAVPVNCCPSADQCQCDMSSCATVCLKACSWQKSQPVNAVASVRAIDLWSRDANPINEPHALSLPFYSAIRQQTQESPADLQPRPPQLLG